MEAVCLQRKAPIDQITAAMTYTRTPFRLLRADLLNQHPGGPFIEEMLVLPIHLSRTDGPGSMVTTDASPFFELSTIGTIRL